MKKKSVLAVVLSLCLVAVVAIGATLALLSDKTNTVTNRFTVSQKGIDIDLKSRLGMASILVLLRLKIRMILLSELIWLKTLFPAVRSPRILL